MLLYVAKQHQMTKISQYRLEKVHILDASLVQIKGYISVYMPIHYLSKYLISENKSFIEFTSFGYQTGVFQSLGLF